MDVTFFLDGVQVHRRKLLHRTALFASLSGEGVLKSVTVNLPFHRASETLKRAFLAHFLMENFLFICYRYDLLDGISFLLRIKMFNVRFFRNDQTKL